MDHVSPDQRAGWWRRSLALAVDGLCVAIPSAVVGAALFALTGGFLQWSSPGLQWQRCGQVAVPAGLQPPPPDNSNAALLCESSSIAGIIGRELTVSRVTKTATSSTSVGTSYTVPNSGEPGGHDLSWLTGVALLAILVVGEWRKGSTPGKRLLGVRVAEAAAPDGRVVPLKKVAIRYGVVIGVYALLFGALLGFLAFAATRPDGPPSFSFPVFALLIVAVSAWSLWNTMRIVRRRQTVYDAVAGIEVVRVAARPAPPAITAPAPAPA